MPNFGEQATSVGQESGNATEEKMSKQSVDGKENPEVSLEGEIKSEMDALGANLESLEAHVNELPDEVSLSERVRSKVAELNQKYQERMTGLMAVSMGSAAMVATEVAIFSLGEQLSAVAAPLPLAVGLAVILAVNQVSKLRHKFETWNETRKITESTI